MSVVCRSEKVYLWKLYIQGLTPFSRHVQIQPFEKRSEKNWTDIPVGSPVLEVSTKLLLFHLQSYLLLRN